MSPNQTPRPSSPHGVLTVLLEAQARKRRASGAGLRTACGLRSKNRRGPGPWRWLRRLAPFMAVVCAAPSGAQQVDPALWVTNSQVLALARDGNTIYVGGLFTEVGPATGGGVPLNGASGELVRPFPRVTGRVFAVVPDGAGGWYIGGFFTAVGGLPRSNLAHILADGSIAAWAPQANGWVHALAVSGSTVYAGGRFTSVGSADSADVHRPRNRGKSRDIGAGGGGEPLPAGAAD